MSFCAKKHAKVRKKYGIPYLLRFFNLTLSQFKLRVFLVDNEKATLATYYLAIGCALL